VNEAQLAQLIRLEDGIRDRAADAGGGGRQGGFSAEIGVVSTTVYINRR
jgi:hypothetical protein